MAIGQERLGENPAEIFMECQSYFEIWSTESRKMSKEHGKDESGPAAGHPSREVRRAAERSWAR